MMIENTLVTVISLSTPLVIAVIGETISEKSGVINLSAEGTIMFSALCGFVFGYLTDFAIVGFLSAAILTNEIIGLREYIGAIFIVSACFVDIFKWKKFNAYFSK